jgi:hypothetical protein
VKVNSRIIITWKFDPWVKGLKAFTRVPCEADFDGLDVGYTEKQY